MQTVSSSRAPSPVYEHTSRGYRLGGALPQLAACNSSATSCAQGPGARALGRLASELYEGVHYSRDPQESQRRLSDLLEAVTLLGVDEDTCKLFGEHRGRLRAARMLIGDFDLMIGATALQHDLTLMTNNPSPLRQG